MSAPVQQPKAPPQLRLVGALFVHAVSFAGTSTGVHLSRNLGEIRPARLEADGTPVAVDKGQRSDGVLLRKAGSPTGLLGEVAFVPWANVQELQYSYG